MTDSLQLIFFLGRRAGFQEYISPLLKRKQAESSRRKKQETKISAPHEQLNSWIPD